jgi:hypothetical protein
MCWENDCKNIEALKDENEALIMNMRRESKVKIEELSV